MIIQASASNSSPIALWPTSADSTMIPGRPPRVSSQARRDTSSQRANAKQQRADHQGESAGHDEGKIRDVERANPECADDTARERAQTTSFEVMAAAILEQTGQDDGDPQLHSDGRR
jgi:hypothetical protein